MDLSGRAPPAISIGRPLASKPVGPVHLDEVLRRDQLAVRAVDHEEEAVLRRVHHHLARLAVDLRSARIIGWVAV